MTLSLTFPTVALGLARAFVASTHSPSRPQEPA
ncbi:hypothetical protein SCNRRL3882_0955 [Streptomyces chartreusis NRRL 3882]|uniref:Uncharacterized protein n=1 Tax=Streptomyces chartreusis NRRL 3882 TaxID=1079985 RepID=A0A2N9B2A9_STRCX|nr:hypothetical protein SCNRRL3882_0955 [Streptomyces chartreusis NRRL 3882]